MILVDEHYIRLKWHKSELIVEFEGICLKLCDLGVDADTLHKCIDTRNEVKKMFKNTGEIFINGNEQANQSITDTYEGQEEGL